VNLKYFAEKGLLKTDVAFIMKVTVCAYMCTSKVCILTFAAQWRSINSHDQAGSDPMCQQIATASGNV
jgi:hypothetical protein